MARRMDRMESLLRIWNLIVRSSRFKSLWRLQLANAAKYSIVHFGRRKCVETENVYVCLCPGSARLCL